MPRLEHFINILNHICFLVLDAKRLIGRNFDDISVQSNMRHWPFTVVDNKNSPKLKFENREEIFSAEEISSIILTKMKENAEAYLGKVCT